MRLLRVALGPREYDAITTALGYFLDSWVDPGDEPTPEERAALRRASGVWDKLARERARQRVGWDATGRRL